MELKSDVVRLNINLGGLNLFADITQYAMDELTLDLGKEIFIGFKAAAIAVVKL